MKILIINETQNTFIGTITKVASGYFRKDGDEFVRQADYCERYYTGRGHDVVRAEIPKSKKTALQKRQWLFGVLDEDFFFYTKYDRVIFLCHGHPKALNRKMISDLNIEPFRIRVSRIASDDCKIILFACKTGKLVDGTGFADKLSDRCGLNVVAHSTSGHTTKNPDKFHFGPFDVTDMANRCGRTTKQLQEYLWSSDAAPFDFVENYFEDMDEQNEKM